MVPPLVSPSWLEDHLDDPEVRIIEVTIIDKNGKTQKIKKNSKKFVASLIAKKIVDTFLLNEKSLN